MRRLMSLISPFVLAVVLAFGSVGFARSHHLGAGVDQYVICTGYGVVTITVDEHGNRVAEGAPCPDSMALSAALPVAMPLTTFERITVASIGPIGAQHVDHNQISDAWRDARAPPAPVLA